MHHSLRTCFRLFVFVAVCSAAYSAKAQGEPPGPEIVVSSDLATSAPDVAVATDESWTAVWFGSGASGDGVYSRTFSASAVPSAATRLDVAPDTGELPVIARTTTGYVVAWRSPGTGSLFNITARRLNLDGTARGVSFRVVTGVAGMASRIALGAAADGRFVVAWSSPDPVGISRRMISAMLVSAGDIPQGSSFRVDTAGFSTSYGSSQPSVAMFDSGGFIAIWTYDTGGTGSRDDVHGRRFLAGGTPNGAEFQVNTYTIKFQNNPSVSATPSGSHVATWTSEDNTLNQQDGSGAGVYGDNGGEFRLNDYTLGQQEASDVAVTSTGDFIGVWTSAAQDGSESGVYGARYRSDGARVGAEFRANTVTTGSQSRPAVAVSSGGRAVIVWADASRSRIVGVRTRVSTAVSAEEAPGDANRFTVSPSPIRRSGSSAAQFEMATAGPVRLSVVDMLGREVGVVLSGELPAGSHTFQIDTAALPAGAYALCLVRGTRAETRLLTVTR